MFDRSHYTYLHRSFALVTRKIIATRGVVNVMHASAANTDICLPLYLQFLKCISFKRYRFREYLNHKNSRGHIKRLVSCFVWKGISVAIKKKKSQVMIKKSAHLSISDFFFYPFCKLWRWNCLNFLFSLCSRKEGLKWRERCESVISFEKFAFSGP